jgi:glycosyltransferase involved in cell wall biosynthesis
MKSFNTIGVVIIGRNEGQRLTTCIQSIITKTKQVVYVDSNSTDDSVQNAKKLGVQVVELDLSIPFTAARARNQGFKKLIELYPNIEFVQFVDGDCEINANWFESAYTFLINNQNVAAVCGRRRERFPEYSIYNKLCDQEWNTEVGETKAFGGDVLIRTKAVQSVGGYNETLIAGEEPELCVRLRKLKWKIWRIDEEMTLHDANMSKFSQWWNRTRRAGHAFIEGAYLHGKPPERHWVTETVRPWIWGGIVPIATLVGFFVNFKVGLIILLLYPAQILRMKVLNHKSWFEACLMVIGKFAELQGQLVFVKSLILKRRSQIIEYK